MTLLSNLGASVCVVLLMFVQSQAWGQALSGASEISIGPKSATAPALKAVGIPVPVVFEANAGQRDRSTSFIHRSTWGSMSVRQDSLDFQLNAPAAFRMPPTDKRVDWLDISQSEFARANVQLMPVDGTLKHATGADQFRAKATVYDGNDRKRIWRRVNLFGQVQCEKAWPGAILNLTGTGGELAYEITLSPQADIESIEFEIKGASEIKIGDRGELRIVVKHGELIFSTPRFFAYKDGERTGTRKRELKGSYRLNGNRIGFKCENRAASESLLIDPTIDFASFPETLDSDYPSTIANSLVRPYGTNVVYLCVVKPDSGTGNDAEPEVTVYCLQVADPTNPTLIYQSTFEDFANITDIAVAPDGRLYLGGSTRNGQLATSQGAYQETAPADVSKMVVMRLSQLGEIQNATYVGEPNQVSGFRISYHLNGIALATDNSDNLIVAAAGSCTISNDSGTSASIPNYQGPGDASPSEHQGGVDICFLTMNEELTNLNSLQLQGASLDYERLESVETADGEFIAAGITASFSFPTVGDVFQDEIGEGLPIGTNGNSQSDMIITRYKVDGSQLYLTLLGGPADDILRSFTATPTGEPIVLFSALESDPNIDSSHAAVKLNANANALEFLSTDFDQLSPLFGWFDGAGTTAAGVPVAVLSLTSGDAGVIEISPDAFDSNFGGGNELLFTYLGDDGDVQYASYIGGNNMDLANDLSVDVADRIWIAGITVSSDFPATFGEPTQDPFGGTDVFLVRIAPDNVTLSLSKSDEADPVASGSLVVYNIVATNSGDEPLLASQLVDQIPQGMSLVLPPANAVVNGSEVTIPVPPLNPGESFSTSMTVSADDAGTHNNTVNWIVGGISQAIAVEPTTVIDAADLPQLLVTIEGTSPYDPGESHVYRFRVSNIGQGMAENVVFQATSPSIKTVRFDGLGLTTPDADASITGDEVIWTIGDLPGGDDTSIDVLATAGDAAGSFEITTTAITSTLIGFEVETVYEGAITGHAVDLSIEVQPQETSGNLVLRPLVIAGDPNPDEPFGPVNVVVTFTTTENPLVVDGVRLVTAGPTPPKIPVPLPDGIDRWVMSVNLNVTVGVPQTIHIRSPVDFPISEIKAIVSAQTVLDPDESNNEVDVQ